MNNRGSKFNIIKGGKGRIASAKIITYTYFSLIYMEEKILSEMTMNYI